MSAFINNPLSSNFLNTYKKCKPVQSILPPFAPIISNISVNTSVAGQYSMVYINGMNFFNQGITYVNFGTYTNIPITYYGSYNISFIVPSNASAGNYNVVVVNIYNGQLSSQQSTCNYPGVLNYSNSVPYTLT
jgi:hypothetical protein